MKRKMMVLFSVFGVLTLLYPSAVYAVTSSHYNSYEGIYRCWGMWSNATLHEVNYNTNPFLTTSYWTCLGTYSADWYEMAEIGLSIKKPFFGSAQMRLFAKWWTNDGEYYDYEEFDLGEGLEYAGEPIGLAVCYNSSSLYWLWFYKTLDDDNWVNFYAEYIGWWRGDTARCALEESNNFPYNADNTPIVWQDLIYDLNATSYEWNAWDELLDGSNMTNVAKSEYYNHCYWKFWNA